MASGPDQNFQPTQVIDVSASRKRNQQRWGLPNVAIVTGDVLSDEARETLRKRLLAATLVILFGFSIYLVRSYFDDRPLQGFHTLVVFALFGFVAVLVSKLDLTTKHLRLLELGIFGIPILFFVPYHYMCVMQELGDKDPVGVVAIYKNVASYWFCLLVIYGIFVPNNWKRAAIVVSPMVVLPVLTGIVASVRHPLVGEHLNLQQLTDTLMILTVGGLCSAYGAEVINSLRTEARQAKHFGQYILHEKIGKGGMGEVYKAEHQLLKRPCALKLIRPEHAGNPEALSRFEREVRTTAKLTHWNTIDIYDYGRTDDGTLYYVMEYLPGMSLRQLIDHCGKIPPARTAHIISQICGALSEAHGMAFIHRDINPNNIFITQRGGVYDVAKLLDFGLVKISGTADETQLTQLGSVSGTPKYMSPEQASGSVSPGVASDLYSLGAVAYTMLAGRPPFEGASIAQLMASLVRVKPTPITDSNPDVPPNLVDAIMRCLEKEPSARYSSAEDFRRAILSCSLTWTEEDAKTWWQSFGSMTSSMQSQSDSHASTGKVGATQKVDHTLTHD